MNMNWEMLPDDVWSLISWKLDAAADRVRFRAVCKTWMSLIPFPPPIWLMIPQSHHHKNKEEQEQGADVISCRRGFVIAGEHRVYHHLDLPDKRCVGSTGTCLVTVDLDGNICVLDLISRVEISLPPQSTKKKLGTDSFIVKIVLSSTDITKDCVAMAIRHHQNKLAIARPGDVSWTLLDSNDVCIYHLEDIIFCKGKFYGVCSDGLVMTIQVGDSMDSCEILYFTEEILEYSPEYCSPKRYYLVEWMGELVLVVRRIAITPYSEEEEKDINHAAGYNTGSFQLYKLDLQNKHLYKNNWIELNS